MATALAQARRRDEPIAVVMLDIDFFKRVNDEHGHAVGDLVLETFAAAALRTGEMFAEEIVAGVYD